MKVFLCSIILTTYILGAYASEIDYISMKRDNKLLQKNFKKILTKNCTFRTCLMSNFDSVYLIITLMSENNIREASKVKIFVKENLEKMNNFHNICHSVSIQDAKLFYANYPSLSACVDELLSGVNLFRTHLNKIQESQILTFQNNSDLRESVSSLINQLNLC